MNFLAVIEYLFFITVFFYSIYLLSFFKVLLYKTSEKQPISQPSVSVLICAKNEAQNIVQNLPLILNQKYSSFEVIVVNDQSSDETLQVLKDIQRKSKHLKVITSKGKSSKKNALKLAKENAFGDVFVLTDIDCKINSDVWLQKMVSSIKDQSQVVLGYGPNIYDAGFLNKLQRFETLTTALQYFTSALYNSPYMGVGRNLAYTQKLDKKITFSKTENQLLSGDDDLWIQKAKKFSNMEVQLEKETFAYSYAETTFASWWNQKKRHITTANHYSFKDQILLSGIFLTKTLFWLTSIILIFQKLNVQVLLPFLTLNALILVVYRLASLKMKEKKIWIYSPLLDFILICFQLCLFISNLVQPSKKWK